MTGLSFEFFPPRSDKARRSMMEAVKTLTAFEPDYVSVTFGAGGSTRNGTLDTLNDIHERTAVTTAAHLCYSGLDRNDVLSYADRLWEAGHRKIVALRGDADAGDAPTFADTPEFVRVLRERHPFALAVACYPEVHPKASSLEDDIGVLLAKQEAGASEAITQFFFDNDVFHRFVAKARSAGVTIPIVPGVLPIHDLDKAVSFAETCGASVPQWVRERFQRDPHAGRCLIVEQVEALRREGVDHLHVYALNKAELSADAARAFLAEGNERIAA